MKLVLLAGLAVPAPLAAQVCPPAPPAEFAPSVADSGRLYHGAVSLDGRELWFFKKVGRDPHAENYRLFRSILGGQGWGATQQMTIGAEASDLYPAFTSDGRRLVFSSYRRAPGDTLAHPSASLWVADREGSGFGEPNPIGAVASPGYYFSQVGTRPDGSLYYRRTSPDWKVTESWLSAQDGITWAAPVPDTLVNRWMGWRADSLLVWGGERSPDGNAIVLEIAERDPVTRRPRQTDIWVSVRRNEVWEEPRRLGPSVNDPAVTDNFAFFSPDGCTLIWTRDFSRFMAASWTAAIHEVTTVGR